MSLIPNNAYQAVDPSNVADGHRSPAHKRIK
jgi:hypothetical protein